MDASRGCGLKVIRLASEQHKTFGNGMTGSHGYDPAGRERLIENRKASWEAVGVFTGTFDAVGNRLTGLELDGTTVTNRHDPSDQLICEARDCAAGYFASYSYDGVGNRLVRVLSPTEDEVYRYAGNGRRRSKESSGATTLFTWDGENLLLETDTTPGPRREVTDWPGYWGGLAIS